MSSKFKKANDEVKPTGYVDYKVYLHHLYQYLKSQEDKYSYLKFAEDLGFKASGIMNQVIKGRRRLTPKFAQKIAKALKLESRESKYLESLVSYTHADDPGERDKLFDSMVQLKQKKLENPEEQKALDYFSEWYHPVIREMVGLKEFNPDPHWIAKKIFPNIRPAQAESSLQLLVDLGYVHFDAETGKYTQAGSTVRTPKTVRNIAVSSFHHHMIGLAQQNLAASDGKDRNITGITVTLSEAQFKELKEKLTEYQIKLLNDIEKEKSDEGYVYQLNTQLFKVSQ